MTDSQYRLTFIKKQRWIGKVAQLSKPTGLGSALMERFAKDVMESLQTEDLPVITHT